MKVVILCGGAGRRLEQETEARPKPMVPVGGAPILLQIMETYARRGYSDFILCLGYKGEMIKDYFLNHEYLTNDITIDLKTGEAIVHRGSPRLDWRVSLIDTGPAAETGARLKRVEPYIDSDPFMLTYGDGLTDLDISAVEAFHGKHGKIGTVTGVRPPSRYGELAIEGDQVKAFQEKPTAASDMINGGYFVFSRKFLEYLDDDARCILERAPLERLARDGELRVFRHEGFWQCMDTPRDLEYLNSLAKRPVPPWKT